jgi:hypothetical protein
MGPPNRDAEKDTFGKSADPSPPALAWLFDTPPKSPWRKLGRSFGWATCKRYVLEPQNIIAALSPRGEKRRRECGSRLVGKGHFRLSDDFYIALSVPGAIVFVISSFVHTVLCRLDIA